MYNEFKSTPPKFTASLPLKMDGWKTILSFWGKRPILRGGLLNFRGVFSWEIKNGHMSLFIFCFFNSVSTISLKMPS